MRKALIVGLVCASLSAPALGGAQTGVGLAVKAGTMGVGAEAAIGLGSSLALRGGAALLPVNLDPTYSDIRFELDMPDSYVNLGLDFYPGGGPFRVGGGLLYKPDEPSLTGTFTEVQEIGGREYTPEQIGTLIGEIDSRSTAPYLLLGFGRHTSTGFGFFTDVGFAILEEPTLSIRQEGGSLTGAQRAEFNQRLETERVQIEDDLGRWLRIYPIVQMGVRLGLGG
jgi:hypothetical protein